MWMATLLELQLVDERSFWRGGSERFDDQTIISYIDKKNVWIGRDDRLQINSLAGVFIAEASFLLPVLVVVARTFKTIVTFAAGTEIAESRNLLKRYLTLRGSFSFRRRVDGVPQKHRPGKE